MTLHIALDVALKSGGGYGGVEQFIIGLVDGLRRTEVDLHITLVTDPLDADWIEPHAGPDMDIVMRGNLLGRTRKAISPLDSAILPLARPFLGRLNSRSVPSGFYEGLDADLVHFPFQIYHETSLPTVFNPHDLQHETYPEFFSERELDKRRTRYDAGCRNATAIDVPSTYTKNHVVDTYDVDPDRIYVIPRGPPIALYDESEVPDDGSLRQQYDLPSSFAFYPAQSWPHKNHLRLVEALAELRETRGLTVPLVCTGSKTDHWETVAKRSEDLGIANQVTHLSYVPAPHLRALYRYSTFVVFPSLFEGGGFPLLEAWSEGTAVTCADATALTEKAGEAAALFDPESVGDIAETVARLYTDSEYRAALATRGRERVDRFDWRTTARCYRALYRRVVDAPLTDDQGTLLDAARSGDLPEQS